LIASQMAATFMRFGLVPATDKILRGMNEPFLDTAWRDTVCPSHPEVLSAICSPKHF
jgi:hypothetical protein